MPEKRIKTYEDLEAEKTRLMGLLRTQEELIKVDIAGVKEGLKPFGRAMKTVNKFFTRDNKAPIMNFGLEMGIDLLVRRFLLARAGWLTKVVVPFFIKNYSSHLIGEEKRAALFKKVENLLRKIRPKKDATYKRGSTAEPA